MEIDGIVLKEGDYISINGTTGEVYVGQVETKAAELSGDFAELMALADKYTKLQVRTNADTPHDASIARSFGAVGIGLCRNWIRRHARKTGGGFLRAGGADWADAGCDDGGNGAFGARVLGVFAFGTENSEHCPIL